jgi:copper(I)-binding protein
MTRYAHIGRIARKTAPFVTLAVLSGFALLPHDAALAATPLTVSDAWFRYITPQVPAGGYMRLENHSRHEMDLVGADSPACEMVMIHRSESRSGAESMMEVSQVKIPPGRSVSFAPGGYHLMCMTPHMQPGQHVPVTLDFKDSRKVKAEFAVFGARGKPTG